jgi:hypothetical protein
MAMSTSLSMKGGVPRAVADVVASGVDPAAACMTGARRAHRVLGLDSWTSSLTTAWLGWRCCVEESCLCKSYCVGLENMYQRSHPPLLQCRPSSPSAHLHHCMLPPLLYAVLLRRRRPRIRQKVHLASSPSVCQSAPHPPCAARESDVHLVARLDPQQAS